MKQKEDSGRKPNLGMGLSALFGDSRPTLGNPGGTQGAALGAVVIQEIPLTQIEANEDQPRKIFDENELMELASSIQENGVLQPILLRKMGADKYQIIAGERRFRATGIAKLQSIPSIIVNGKSDAEILHMALLENIQRANLSAVEEGYAYKNLVDNFGCTHEKIAKTLGKSRAHVTNSIRILKLPKEALDMVASGQLSFGHAKVLSGLDNPGFWAQVAVEKNLTVRGLEDLMSNKMGDDDSSDTPIEPMPQRKRIDKKPAPSAKDNNNHDKEKQALDDLAHQVTRSRNIDINVERDEDEDGAFYLIIKCRSKADTEDLLKKLR